jgi:hypothetical protein
MVSGLWAIMTFSGLQGQTALVSPSWSGTPTLCTHFTKGAPRASRRITSVPTRVMIRMLMATYALSVSSIPILESGEPGTLTSY